MMRQKLLWLTILGLLCCMPGLFAQVPQVDNTLHFAGMKLRLTEQARRDIQASVDALYRSEHFFNLRLEQVDLYMPLIEPVFEKYGVPEEFKYLVIQESGLVPDAVSSSNAVGFWQFKEASATELGLRIDRQVDERMNIVSATEGAAKYLLRSNAEFDNWIYSLQSYMVGQGGTSRSVDKRHYGAREMKIDGNTHWYIKKFLAHLVAYEPVTGRQTRYKVLYPYTGGANKSLRLIAREFDTDEEQLHTYNKWLKTSSVPDDKEYTILIPLQVDQSQDLLALTEEDKSPEGKEEKERDNEAYGHKQQQPEPLPKAAKGQLALVELNNLQGVVAREGDKAAMLAELGNLSESRFRRYNDLAYGDKVEAGQFYYLEKKRRRARVYEHVLQPGESLWQVSQQYGVRLKKLRQKNRLEAGEEPKAGRVLWLRFIRPPYEEVEHREVIPPKEPLYASTAKKEGSISASLPAETASPARQQELPPQEEPLEEKPLKKEPTPPAQEAAREMEPIPAGKLLMPADTPVTQKKPAQQLPREKEPPAAETPVQVQADTAARKVPVEKKEKAGSESIPSPSQPTSSTDSFAVEEPVTFVEEKALPTEQKSRTHSVEAGETLYSLSRQYGVSVQDLIRWNELPAEPVLSIGQELKVSAPAAAEAIPAEAEEAPVSETDSLPEPSPEMRYHTVAPGESMYRVARMYNVTIKDIMRWNNKENFDIKEGERLIVGTEE